MGVCVYIYKYHIYNRQQCPQNLSPLGSPCMMSATSRCVVYIYKYHTYTNIGYIIQICTNPYQRTSSEFGTSGKSLYDCCKYIYIYMYIYQHIDMYTCINVYMCIYIHICTYIHLNIANKKPFVYDYRETKMPHLYRVFPSKEPYDE